MPSGNITQQALITPESIRDALNAITRPYDDDVAFLYSSLVEEYLQHPKYDRVGPKSSRLHAMTDAIFDVMSESLDQARRAVGIDPRPDHSRQNIIANMKADAYANKAELAILSCYYYRYVANHRIESNTEFASIVGKSVRDIQRLLKRGVPRIVDRFINAELASQRRTQRARIIAELPDHRQMIGCDRLIRQISDLIRNQDYSFTILSGPPGIGKTALACAAIRKAIETHAFGAFVRIDRPENVENIKQAILSTVEAPVDNVTAFRAFTQSIRVLVLIDDARLTSKQLTECVHLLAYCHVVLTMQHAPNSLQSHVKHSPLHDLSDDDARSLALEIALENGADPITAEQAADKALAEAGGNPQRIQLFTSRYISGLELITINNHIIQSTLSHDDAIFATLILLCLAHRIGISEGEVSNIQSLASLRSDRSLVYNTLAYYRNNRFYAENSIIKLVTSQGQPLSVRQEVGRVVNVILRNFQHFPEQLRIAMGDSLVTDRWLANEYWDFVAFITQFHQLARESNQLDAWLNAFLNYIDTVEQPEVMVYVSLASILRRQNKHDAAIAAATEAIKLCGTIGDFVGVGWGTAELGAIYLTSGHFEIAAQALQDALDYAQRLDEMDLLQFVHSLLAKLFLELEDYQSAAEHIAHVPQSWTTLVMQCDIATRLSRWGQVHEALNLLDSTLMEQSEGQYSKAAELVLLKGHLYFAQGLYRLATSFYQLAAEKFGIAQQFMKQARVKTNVGACYVQDEDKREEGIRILISVLNQQRQLNDIVGIAATRKNLEYAQFLAENEYPTDERLDEQDTDQ